MQFIAIPTEQTTAITDAVLGLEAILLALYLQRFLPLQSSRVRYWQVLLLLTAAASLIGAIAHGFAMSEATYEALWQPLKLTLGLIVANLVLAAIFDIYGAKTAQRVGPWLLVVALCFFGVTFIEGTTFLIFIVYEAAGMLFCLAVYTILGLTRRLAGAGIIAAGIILQLTAAAVQACGPFEIRLIYLFDHNGMFHIIGMLATLVMIFGVTRGFEKRAE